MSVDINKDNNKPFFLFTIFVIAFIVLVLEIDVLASEDKEDKQNENNNVTFLSGVEGVWNVSWGNYSSLEDEKVNTDVEKEKE